MVAPRASAQPAPRAGRTLRSSPASRSAPAPAPAMQLCGCYIQPIMGATFAIPALALVTGAVSSIAGFAVTYIAYAANGGSYEGYSAAKGEAGRQHSEPCRPAALHGLPVQCPARIHAQKPLLWHRRRFPGRRSFGGVCAVYHPAHAPGIVRPRFPDGRLLDGCPHLQHILGEAAGPWGAFYFARGTCCLCLQRCSFQPGFCLSRHPPTSPRVQFEEPGFGPVAVPFPPNKAGYYIFLDLIIPAGVAVPVVWLVMPAPAGRKVCCCSGGPACPCAWRAVRGRGGSRPKPACLHLLPCVLLTPVSCSNAAGARRLQQGAPGPRPA
jgi:hypothetical protein